MKRNLNYLLCFLLLALSIVCLNNNLNSNLNLNVLAEGTTKEITVCGTGKISIAPDMAIIKIGVITTNSDLNSAVEENSTKVSSVLEYIKSLNINEEDIVTKNYYAYQRLNFNDEEKLSEYHVETKLEFKSKDLTNLSNIITNLTEHGANQIDGISFTCSNIDERYNDALKLALENAQSKADILAGSTMKVCKINEKSIYCNAICKETFGFSKLNKDFITNGNLEIEANIEVTFCE